MPERKECQTLFGGFLVGWIFCERSCRTWFPVLSGRFLRTCMRSTLKPHRSNEGLWSPGAWLTELGTGPWFWLTWKMCLRAFCMMKALLSSSQSFWNGVAGWFRGMLKSLLKEMTDCNSASKSRMNIGLQFVGSTVFWVRVAQVSLLAMAWQGWWRLMCRWDAWWLWQVQVGCFWAWGVWFVWCWGGCDFPCFPCWGQQGRTVIWQVLSRISF